MSSGSPFDLAAFALVRAARGEGDFGRDEYEPLLNGLGRYLRAAFPTFERETVLDLVSLTLERFIAYAGEGRAPREPPAAGAYLTTIARNAAIDTLRRERRAERAELDVDELPGVEEGAGSLERTIEILGGRQQTLELRERALAAGRGDLVDLVDAYLRLARDGHTATLRELGAALSISHTEVRLRLDELAALAGGGKA